jgi:hypothetical protein
MNVIMSMPINAQVNTHNFDDVSLTVPTNGENNGNRPFMKNMIYLIFSATEVNGKKGICWCASGLHCWL